MSEARLTNAQIDPEVFTDYTLEPSIYQSRFFNSGIIVRSAILDNFLNGNGEVINLPFWKDTAGTTGDAPIEGTDATVNAITSGSQKARKQVRNKAWGTNNLVTVFAGSNPLDGAIQRVTNYWAQAFDQLAIKSFQGVLADNIANDSSDIVNNISGETGTAAYFSDEAVIDAQAKLGENGVVGFGDSSDFVAILVHPLVYAWMRKQDLIDFDPVSMQTRPMGSYMGMAVIVDRNAPVDTGVYDSFIFKAGAMAFGIGTQGYLPTELDRNILDGFGVDRLVTRRAFALHPLGTAIKETNISGITPTDAELAEAASWDRVVSAENMPFVVLKHKIG